MSKHLKILIWNPYWLGMRTKEYQWKWVQHLKTPSHLPYPARPCPREGQWASSLGCLGPRCLLLTSRVFCAVHLTSWSRGRLTLHLVTLPTSVPCWQWSRLNVCFMSSASPPALPPSSLQSGFRNGPRMVFGPALYGEPGTAVPRQGRWLGRLRLQPVQQAHPVLCVSSPAGDPRGPLVPALRVRPGP